MSIFIIKVQRQQGGSDELHSLHVHWNWDWEAFWAHWSHCQVSKLQSFQFYQPNIKFIINFQDPIWELPSLSYRSETAFANYTRPHVLQVSFQTTYFYILFHNNQIFFASWQKNKLRHGKSDNWRLHGDGASLSLEHLVTGARYCAVPRSEGSTAPWKHLDSREKHIKIHCLDIKLRW